MRLRVDGRKAPAGIVRSLAGVVKEFPGEMPVIVAIATSQGETTLRSGAGLPGQAGAGLLRRGEVAPRRSRGRLSLTRRAGIAVIASDA